MRHSDGMAGVEEGLVVLNFTLVTAL